MTLKATPATKNAILNAIGLKEQLDDGFLYIFSGAAPATVSPGCTTSAANIL